MDIAGIIAMFLMPVGIFIVIRMLIYKPPKQRQ
jgi:hypothetical protein